MIPIGDENPTFRRPFVTILLLATMVLVWLVFQGGGFDEFQLAASVCNWGLVPGEITHRAPLGFGVPLGQGVYCVVDSNAANILTPFTSMFLHGGWLHLLGNCLFLWVFGNNVEDSMGRLRFIAFYLICGLAAAALQVAVDPSSAVPMVGASGAISGVLGAYLMLYPKVRVRVVFVWVIFVQILRIPAWAVLLWWIGLQLVDAFGNLSPLRPEVSGGVAVWAHIGGFVAGALLVKVFQNRKYVTAHKNAIHAYEAFGVS